MPELLAMGLEAEQRMIGGSPFLLGIVANARALLVPVEGQDQVGWSVIGIAQGLNCRLPPPCPSGILGAA